MATNPSRPICSEFPELDVRVVEDAHALRRLAADLPPGASMVVIVVGAKPQAMLASAESGAGGEATATVATRQVAEPLGVLLRLVASAEADLEELRPGPLHLHALVLDPGARMAQRGDRPLPLTAAEFDMLHALMRCSGRVLSRDELSRAALGRSYRPPDRSVDMHVCNLRRKLAATGGEAWLIKSVRSRGYLMPPGDPVSGPRATGNGSAGG